MKKFEKTKENRSEAGKRGADARWQNIANDGKRINAMAKMAVNDNDNVNDNENVINNTVAFSFKKSLCALEVDNKIANEYMKVRKTKKAVNTETAFNSLKNQIEKTTLSANEVITKCVEMSWSGFNAEWLKDKTTEHKKIKAPNYGY